MTNRAQTYHTWSPKASDLRRDWLVVDVEDQVLGRIATQIASMLRGKHKPTYAPHVDNGDNVIVLNAEKVRVTGRKADQIEYIRHTGYPGGLKRVPYRTMMQKHPERIIKAAVKGMLPKNRLGRRLLKKLYVYAGPRHPHTAQQPRTVQLTKIS
jgi:large subunit ribosomal protein L13